MSFLFGKTPKPEDPVRMPVPQDQNQRLAEERRRRAIAGRSGRASTILSRSNSGGAGVSSYTNSLLGQAG